MTLKLKPERGYNLGAWPNNVGEVEKSLLSKMARGASGTALELQGQYKYAWQALINLERRGLIWRAFDYEDWRTLHKWKVTGCGLIVQQTPGA
jgi:hypothetical protein